MRTIKRWYERQMLGGMIEDGGINERTDLWIWHCVAEYFTHE